MTYHALSYVHIDYMISQMGIMFFKPFVILSLRCYDGTKSECMREVILFSLEHSKHLKQDVSRGLQGCLRGVCLKFQGCFKEISRMFQVSFKVVYKKF